MLSNVNQQTLHLEMRVREMFLRYKSKFFIQFDGAFIIF